MGHVNPNIVQASFRARNDDGNEATASWQAAVNTNWTQPAGAAFRVRFLLQETAGGTEKNELLQCQYRLNAGAWTNVTTTSSVVRAVDTQLIEDGNTTQQIGSGTFITPNDGQCEDGLTGGGVLDFDGNDEVELEIGLQIISADVADSDTVEVRYVRSGGAVLDGYTNTPSVTVSKPVAQTVSGASHTDPDVAFVGSVAAGAVQLGGVLLSDADNTLAGTLVVGPVALAGSLFVDPDVTNAGTISQPLPAQDLSGVLHTDPDAFGVGDLVAGAVTVSGTSLDDSADAIPVGTVAPGAVSLGGVSHSDPDAGLSGVVAVGPVTLGGALHTDGETFFAGSVTIGAVILGGITYQDADTVQPGALTVGAVTLLGSTLAEGDASYPGTVSQLGGPQGIGGVAYADPDTIEAGALAPQPVTLSGVTFSDPDVLFVGELPSGQQLGGVLHIDPDSTPAGDVTPGAVTLSGEAYVNASITFTGVILDGTIRGTHYVNESVILPGNFAEAQTIDGAFHNDNAGQGGGVGTLSGMALGSRRIF